MKISKLFHWLYAFLMFLPIVLFIPNAFYYGFNEHATNSETTTINYKYQSNEVNSVDDLVQNNIYYLDTLLIDGGTLGNVGDALNINLLKFDLVRLDIGNASLDEIWLSDYTNNDDNCLSLYVEPNMFSLAFTNYQAYTNIYFEDTDYIEFDNIVFQYLSSSNTGSSILANSTYTDYNVIESVEINTNDTISNKMYQAWQSTWNLPLLQWTHTSFVAQPFTYITGLFGVPSDSTLNYVFAYFVSISICWLVFDVIMYLPNLAHRWLDRGALE